MCGIVGVIGVSHAAEALVESLRRLEYRGYDSAGVATLVDGKIQRRRAEGKLKNLGRFNNEKEAANKYNEYAIIHFGEYALINEFDDTDEENEIDEEEETD